MFSDSESIAFEVESVDPHTPANHSIVLTPHMTNLPSSSSSSKRQKEIFEKQKQQKSMQSATTSTTAAVIPSQSANSGIVAASDNYKVGTLDKPPLHQSSKTLPLSPTQLSKGNTEKNANTNHISANKAATNELKPSEDEHHVHHKHKHKHHHDKLSSKSSDEESIQFAAESMSVSLLPTPQESDGAQLHIENNTNKSNDIKSNIKKDEKQSVNTQTSSIKNTLNSVTKPENKQPKLAIPVLLPSSSASALPHTPPLLTAAALSSRLHPQRSIPRAASVMSNASIQFQMEDSQLNTTDMDGSKNNLTKSNITILNDKKMKVENVTSTNKEKETHKQISASPSTEVEWHSISNNEMAGVTNESIAFMFEKEEDDHENSEGNINNNNELEDVGHLHKDKHNNSKLQNHQAVHAEKEVEHESKEEEEGKDKHKHNSRRKSETDTSQFASSDTSTPVSLMQTRRPTTALSNLFTDEDNQAQHTKLEEEHEQHEEEIDKITDKTRKKVEHSKEKKKKGYTNQKLRHKDKEEEEMEEEHLLDESNSSLSLFDDDEQTKTKVKTHSHSKTKHIHDKDNDKGDKFKNHRSHSDDHTKQIIKSSSDNNNGRTRKHYRQHQSELSEDDWKELVEESESESKHNQLLLSLSKSKETNNKTRNRKRKEEDDNSNNDAEVKTSKNKLIANKDRKADTTPNTQSTPAETSLLVYTTSTTPINTTTSATPYDNNNNKDENKMEESVNERIARERKAYLREKEEKQEEEEKKRNKNKKKHEMQTSSDKDEEKEEENNNNKEKLYKDDNDNRKKKNSNTNTTKQKWQKESEQRRSHSAQAKLMQSSHHQNGKNNIKDTESNSSASGGKEEYSEYKEELQRLEPVHHRRSHSEGSIFAVLRHLADQEHANPLYRHARSKHIQWNDQDNKYKYIVIKTPTTEHSNNNNNNNNDTYKSKEMRSDQDIQHEKEKEKPSDKTKIENKTNHFVHERVKTSPRVHFHSNTQVEKWQKILAQHDARKLEQEEQQEKNAKDKRHNEKTDLHKHKKHHHHHHHNSEHANSASSASEENSTLHGSESSYGSYSKANSNDDEVMSNDAEEDEKFTRTISSSHTSESNENEPSPRSIYTVPTPITQKHHATKHKHQHFTQTSKNNTNNKGDKKKRRDNEDYKLDAKANTYHLHHQHNTNTKRNNAWRLQNTKSSNRKTGISNNNNEYKHMDVNNNSKFDVPDKHNVDVEQELLEAARQERLHWQEFNRMQQVELEKLKMSLANAEQQQEEDKTLLNITHHNMVKRNKSHYSDRNVSNNRKVPTGHNTKNTNYAAMQMQRSKSNEQRQRSTSQFTAKEHQNQQQEHHYNNQLSRNKNATTRDMGIQRNTMSAHHIPAVSYSSPSSPSPSPQHIHYNNDVQHNKPITLQHQENENVTAEQSKQNSNNNVVTNHIIDKTHVSGEVYRTSSENKGDNDENDVESSKANDNDIVDQSNMKVKEIEAAVEEDNIQKERQSIKSANRANVNGEYDADVAAQVASLLGILWPSSPLSDKESEHHTSFHTHSVNTNLFFITGSRLTQEQVKQFYDVVRMQTKNKRTHKQQSLQQDMVHQLCSFYHFDSDKAININNRWGYYSVKPFRCTSASSSRVSGKRRSHSNNSSSSNKRRSVKSSDNQYSLSNTSKNNVIKDNHTMKSNQRHNINKTNTTNTLVVNHKPCVSRTQILRDVFNLLDVRRCGVIYHADLPMLHMLMEQELTRVDKLLECYHYKQKEQQYNNMKDNRESDQEKLIEHTRSNVNTSLIESSRHEWKNGNQYHKNNINNYFNNHISNDNNANLASCFVGKPLPLFDIHDKQTNTHNNKNKNVHSSAISSSLSLPNTALQGHLIQNTPSMTSTSVPTQDTWLELFADNKYESERQYKEFVSWQRRALLLSFTVNVVLPVIRASQIATLPFATFSLLVLQTVNKHNNNIYGDHCTRKSKMASLSSNENNMEKQQLVEHNAWREVVQQYFAVLSEVTKLESTSILIYLLNDHNS